MPLTPEVAAKAPEFKPASSSWGTAPSDGKWGGKAGGAHGKTLAQRIADKEAQRQQELAESKAAVVAPPGVVAAFKAVPASLAPSAHPTPTNEQPRANRQGTGGAMSKAGTVQADVLSEIGGVASGFRDSGASEAQESPNPKTAQPEAKLLELQAVSAAEAADKPADLAAGVKSSSSQNRSSGRIWGVKLDVLTDPVQTRSEMAAEGEDEGEESRPTSSRNLRGFPEGPRSKRLARPAALLRQNSTVDFESCAQETFSQLPSVVTWYHWPLAQKDHEEAGAGLDGFAAFASQFDASDDEYPASPVRSSCVHAEPSDMGRMNTQPSPYPTQSGPPSLDDFELLKLVGAGGFGKVYQVRKKSSGRIMALKAMRKHLVIQELNVEGTRNERSVLEQIQHPFIVRLHCAFHDTGRLYLLMDWHNGGHLLRLLQEQSPMTENETRFYVAELVLAIEGLHDRGIVHRDLKPENVLLDCQGHLVVTDFGACRIAGANEGEDGDIRTNSWVGTELYMAPEQLTGQVYGRVVDWWAVGVLSFEMLAGDNPFYHENPEQVALKVQKKKLTFSKHLSGPCVSLLKGLLTRDPQKRLGKGGAREVKAHSFFVHKGFKWQSILDRAQLPPFDLGTQDDANSALRVHERYTSVTPVLSPVGSKLLSPQSEAQFAGFEWVSPFYSPAIASSRPPPVSPRKLDLNESPRSKKSMSPQSGSSPFRSPGRSPALPPLHENSISLAPAALQLPRSSTSPGPLPGAARFLSAPGLESKRQIKTI